MFRYVYTYMYLIRKELIMFNYHTQRIMKRCIVRTDIKWLWEEIPPDCDDRAVKCNSEQTLWKWWRASPIPLVDYVQSQQISTNACILTFQVVKHVETHTCWIPSRHKSHGDRFHDLQPPNLMPTSMVVPWSVKVIGGFCVATFKASLLKSPTSNQGSYVEKKLQPLFVKSKH